MKTRIPLYILSGALFSFCARHSVLGAGAQEEKIAKTGTILHHSELGDVIRTGPWGTADKGVVFYEYFRDRESPNRTNRLAKETLFKEVRIEWTLYKDGLKHGPQREWFRSGKPKTESPYEHGKMHGMFKEWDEGGNLVAFYRLRNGNGIRTRYYPNGRLETEVCITNNVRTGLNVSAFDNGQVRSIGFMANDDPVGTFFDFHEDGSIKYVLFARGPLISFDTHGNVREKSWHWHGRSLSEMEYRNIALENPKAPPYFEDAKRYLELLSGEMLNTVREVHARSPVKIPIQLDDREKPVTVPSGTSNQRP